MITISNGMRLLRSCRCGSCGGRVRRINLVQLQRKATWEFPRTENLVSGYGPCANAVLCDQCADTRLAAYPFGALIREAVQIDGERVIYHPLESLEELPEEPTCVVRADGTAIQCLVCGSISHHPSDVQEKYCARCHAFHPIT